MRQHSIQDGEHLITCWCHYERKPASDCTTNHARLDFDTLRGALRMAGVTPKELSGDRMYEVLPKAVEILNAGLAEQVKPATIGVGYGEKGEKP